MNKRNISQRTPRRDRLIRERIHDPYKTRLKLPEPTVCPQCGAVFHEGRWRWGTRPDGANEELCQACHRINDGYPAGEVELKGAFLSTHKPEILGSIRHQEEQEKGEHPLHRIMNIAESDDEIRITTTDIHLPRRIGQALYNAYTGELDFHYDDERYFIRVHWSRER
jgi:hypothetical protein